MEGRDQNPAAIADHGRESGRGFIGFIIAILVVGFVGYSLKQVYIVKARYDDFDVYCHDLLADATRRKATVDDVKFDVIKKAKELGVPIDPKVLEVTGDAGGWRIRYTYDDPVKLPGYTYVPHFVIDHTWKKF